MLQMSEFDRTMFDFEKDLVKKYLNQNNWNITKTAEAMSVSRQVLYFKIRKFAIVKCKDCNSTGWIYNDKQPIRCGCNPTPKKEENGSSTVILPSQIKPE